MQDSATIPDKRALPVGDCCHDTGETPGVGVGLQTWARTWLKVAIALVIAGQAMVFSLGFNTADPRPEYGSLTYVLLNGGLAFSALLVVLLLGLPLFRETYRALRAGKLTVEALFTLTLLGAFAGSLLSSLTGTGDLYYEVVAIVLVIYTIGKTLGARSRAHALEAAARLRTDYDQAWVASCCAEGRKRVPVAELQLGAEVLVAPGEPITVDGVIVQGEGYVAETAINGETAPTKRGPRDNVYAGSFAVDASLTVRCESAAGQRRLDGILTTIEAARLRPSSLQAQADRLARGFVPCVLALSVVTFFGWLAAAPWHVALFNAMAVLLVACPCALGLATPIAVWSGLMNLSRLGLTCGAGDFLDALARARHLVFDKTGTLSHDRLALRDFQLVNGSDEAQLRALIAAAEQSIRHPVAEPLKALATGDAVACTALSTQIVPGKGLEATVADSSGTQHQLLIGSRALMPEGAVFPEHTSEAKRLLYVAHDGHPAAVISLEETLREDAEAVMQQLRPLGVDLAILSGDPEPRWHQLGGVDVRAGLLPQDKVSFVCEREARGEPVVFIGDGINDAAAMAESSGAIAMGEGADLTKSTASAILQGEHLKALPEAIRVCRRIQAAVRSNLHFALIYNVIGIGLAAAGILHPVVAALLMLGSSTWVSYRAARSARVPSRVMEI